MIRSIEFTEGYPTKVRTLKGRRFEFSEGLNVLFGKNGSGKSTLLKAASTYGFTRGGWTTSNWCTLTFLEDVTDPMGTYLRHARAGFSANVDIDGPVFLHSLEGIDGSGSRLGRSGFGQGALSFEMGLVMRMDSNTISAGENIRSHLNRFVDVMEGVKFSLGEKPSGDDPVASYIHERVSSTMLDGKPTVLLDEPDVNLDIPTTMALYDKTLRSLADAGYQVIATTHSPVVLFLDGVNVVDVNSGYSDKCRRMFRKLVGR